jgi:hypothetical protein
VRTLGEENAFALVLEEAARRQRSAKAAALTPDFRGVFRCPYCGFPSRGEACGYHSDLPALESLAVE